MARSTISNVFSTIIYPIQTTRRLRSLQVRLLLTSVPSTCDTQVLSLQ